MLLLSISLLVSSVSCLSNWTNGRYETGRTEEVVLGGRLELLCRQVPEYGDSWGETCNILTPGGDLWTVSATGVTDQEGNMVEGVLPPEEDVLVCGVVILATGQDHLGDWRCRQQGEVMVELVISTEQSLLDIRLPQTFVPQHYNVLLEPDLEAEGQEIVFGGEVSMTVRAVQDTQVFTFHADEITPLAVPEVRLLRGPDGSSPVSVDKLVFDFQRTFVHLVLTGESFAAGAEYQIYLAFSANILRVKNYAYGFYPQVCSETNGINKKCWFTHFESTTARHESISEQYTFNKHFNRLIDSRYTHDDVGMLFPV